nr:F-box/FBD/LRR-repeat protein At1g13570-like [Ipomoea batatas]GMD27343.1 F-box/FBD/LRR-repeat protein At1g13570-like [Ipomoea batatas]
MATKRMDILSELHAVSLTNKMLNALKLMSFQGLQIEKLFIKELLASLSTLEKVVIVREKHYRKKDSTGVMQELLDLPFASTKMKIIIVYYYTDLQREKRQREDDPIMDDVDMEQSVKELKDKAEELQGVKEDLKASSQDVYFECVSVSKGERDSNVNMVKETFGYGKQDSEGSNVNSDSCSSNTKDTNHSTKWRKAATASET